MEKLGRVLAIARAQAETLVESSREEFVADYRKKMTKDALAQKYIPEVYDRSKAAARAVIKQALDRVIPPRERKRISDDIQYQAGILARDNNLGIHSPQSLRAATRARGCVPFHDKVRATELGRMTELQYVLRRFAEVEGNVSYGFWENLADDVNDKYGNNRGRRSLYRLCKTKGTTK